MKKLLYLIANGMAAFADLGVGILIATITWLIVPNYWPWWMPAIAGPFFGVFPDFDVAVPIIVRGLTGQKFEHQHHESLMHWPILILPLVTIIAWLVGGPYLGVTAFFCILAHYIHDWIMMGWREGAKWFFRLHRAHWSRIGAEEPADHDHVRWIEQNWLKPSRLSLWEIAIGTTALGIACAIHTGSIPNGLALMSCFWLGASAVWKMNEKIAAKNIL